LSRENETHFILKWKEEQSAPHQTETEDNPSPDVNKVTTPDQVNVNVSEQGTISNSIDYPQLGPSVAESERVQLVILDSTKDADPDTLVNISAVDSKTVPRTSNRQKKPPATKGNDFLW
jgi:hypothetical protein